MRIGVDIGGTFTDFTLVDEASGTVRLEKILTSVGAAERAVLEGIDTLSGRGDRPLSNVRAVIHATTLVTNTILERKGARTALVTTAGFRDILEIQREVRYDIYDMFIRLPQPIVPRRLRVGVIERVLADGSVRTELDEDEVRAAAAGFKAAGVQAVAVMFLHSYRNPAHEKRAGEILAAALPEAVISLSHEVHPEPKEYERASTTVLDAYVKGVVQAYLDRLTDGLAERGYDRSLFVMLSNGGTATADTAKAVPIQLVESGPAAGVEAAAFVGRLLGLDRVLSFDMGGTTAKLCIVEDGRAARSRMFEVDRMQRFRQGSGLPVAVPVYDLLEIGAGGGSIARINDLGLIEVGPDSAGASPGPACYGLGGTEPTVTDADLLLGHIDPASFLGGDMRLDPDLARRAYTERVAGPGGLSLERAAAGAHEIVNETMASAARQYVAEKGRAPGELTMIAFGGAGPVHAVGLARKLGCPTVVVPPLPGVMSSLGLLVAPLAFERSRAVRRLAQQLDPAGLDALLDELSAEATALLPSWAEPSLRRSLDMRYSGQDHTLEIDLPDGPVWPDGIVRALDGFISAYHDLYGKIDDDNPIEIATARATLTEAPPHIRLPEPPSGGNAAPRTHRRLAAFGMPAVHAPVYDRAALPLGQEIAGPALVEERETTTVIGRGDRLRVGPLGALIIEVAPSRSGEEPALPRLSAELVRSEGTIA